MPQRAPNGVVGVRDVIPTIRPPRGPERTQAHAPRVRRVMRFVSWLPSMVE